MDLTLDGLREIVCKIISGIDFKKECCQYRCHEIARVIKLKLGPFGIEAAVKDGTALYDRYSLLKDCWGDFYEEANLGIEKEFLISKRLGYFHSWCEVNNDPKETIVIDYNSCLALNKNIFLEGVLIVDYKKNLLHEYRPAAISLGNWILFGTLPPRIEKLRI